MKPSRSATAPTGYERLLQDEASESCPDNRGRVWLRIRAICFVGLGISLAFVILIFAASTSLHILPGHSQCMSYLPNIYYEIRLKGRTQVVIQPFAKNGGCYRLKLGKATWLLYNAFQLSRQD